MNDWKSCDNCSDKDCPQSSFIVALCGIEFRPSIASLKSGGTHDFCDICYSKIKIYALSKEESPSD